MQILLYEVSFIVRNLAILSKSSPNLLTHSDLFTIFAPTLATDAPFGVGGPSSEALPFSVGLSLFFLPFYRSQIFLGLLGVDDVVHGQRELSHSFIATGSENRIPSPCLISSFALSTRA